MAADKIPNALVGRNIHSQEVSFLRANLTHENKKVGVPMGVLPRGAIILSCQAFTKTAFNDTKAQIGYKEGSKDICELEVKAVGVKTHTFTEDKMFVPKDEEWPIYVTLDKEVASGEAVIVLEYVTDR